MNRTEITDVFDEIADLLELQGENPFKIRAYRNAARVLRGLGDEFAERVDQGTLTELDGVGKDLAEKMTQLYRTGKLKVYSELKRSVPSGLREMMRIPGLGAKKVKALYESLGVKTLAQLRAAAKKGQVAALSGFGKKTEEIILNGIKNLEAYNQRILWWDANQLAEELLEGLRGLSAVKEAEVAGSLRRKRETVGDIDLLVASTQPEPIMKWLTEHEKVERVLAKGATKSSVRVTHGVQVDLRVVNPQQWGPALVYFTGNKQHNIRLRQRARDKGWSLSEYGFEALDEGKKVPKLSKAKTTEAQVYKALGLPYIPPELREADGEIEAALAGKLPKLVEAADIRGVFHVHTTESDGMNSLEEMAEAAEAMGWEYMGIADHSKSSRQANGLDEERLMRQVEAIQKWNRSKKTKIHLFTGTECDILKDGTLDFADDILEQLDYVVASVHVRFGLDEAEMTKRIIRALEHPCTTMLGHMTGRLLLEREPYALNAEKVIDAAIANGKIIEINAAPKRLDMDWTLWHKARDKGLMTSINPDAHTTEMLRYYVAGVNIARKGWLEKQHVFNTRSLKEVKRYFR